MHGMLKISIYGSITEGGNILVIFYMNGCHLMFDMGIYFLYLYPYLCKNSETKRDHK